MASKLAKTGAGSCELHQAVQLDVGRPEPVSYNLAVKQMSNTAAAAAFVNAHQALVKSWLSSKAPFTKVQAPAAGT